MGKLTGDQSGFTGLEVILIIIIIGIVGGVGWYVYSSNKKANDTYSSAASTSATTTPTFGKSTKSTTATADPTAGWKTYNSSFEQASFKYPDNWTLSSQADTYATQSDEAGAKNVTITSPSGSTLAYADVAFGNKPSCGQPGTITLSKVQPLASTDTPTLYLAERSSNTVALADASLWTNSTVGSNQFTGCGFDPSIQSKTHSDVQFSFMSGGFDVPPSALTSTSDLATSELILASFHY